VSLYAVSDLHIWGPDDPLYRSLLALIRDRAQPGDVIVLVGDLFDLFVGNKKVFLERYREFMVESESACKRGVKIHYIEGNHDFLMRRVFRMIPDFHLYTHDVAVELEGRKFFFAHGDTVDRKDYGYRALRVFFRSPIMRAIVALVPGTWLDWFGNRSAKASRESKPRLPTQLPEGRMEYLRNVYRSFAAERLAQGYDFVVMGHCHDLDEKSFTIGGRTGQYVNVGFPRVHGSFLSWTPGDEKIHRERLPE
jgi:UDP-2,3-diacylglucosamine hydrolase